MRVIQTGPTRDGAVLDIFLSNFNDMLVDSGVAAPIQTGEGVASNHDTVFATFRVPRVPPYTIQEYSYHFVNDEGIEAFGRWLATRDWRDIKSKTTTTDMVEALHEELKRGVDKCFPRKKRKKKSSKPPWITDWIRT